MVETWERVWGDGEKEEEIKKNTNWQVQSSHGDIICNNYVQFQVGARLIGGGGIIL